VLEGVAHRGADLLEAARSDSGVDIHTVRIDGGMSVNPTFAQALADAANCPIEVSPVTEATTIGAGFMAGLGVGVFDSMDDLDQLWRPARIVEPGDPTTHAQRREQWADALERASGWHADLSALEF
jgi:glycerol kinase